MRVCSECYASLLCSKAVKWGIVQDKVKYESEEKWNDILKDNRFNLKTGGKSRARQRTFQYFPRVWRKPIKISADVNGEASLQSKTTRIATKNWIDWQRHTMTKWPYFFESIGYSKNTRLRTVQTAILLLLEQLNTASQFIRSNRNTCAHKHTCTQGLHETSSGRTELIHSKMQ